MSPELSIGQHEQTISLQAIIDRLVHYLGDIPDVNYKDEFVDHVDGSDLAYLWASAIKLMGEPVEPANFDPEALNQALADQFMSIRQQSSALHSFEAQLLPVSAVGDRSEMPAESDALNAPSLITAYAVYNRTPYLRISCPVTPTLGLDRRRTIKIEYTNFSNARNRFTQNANFNPGEPREDIPRDAAIGLLAARKFSELLIECAERTGATTYTAD